MWRCANNKKPRPFERPGRAIYGYLAAALASDLSIRKLSFFFPAFTAAAIHLGIAPRPAQFSDRFFGLRYLGATFEPFSLLPPRLPAPLLSPRAASWLCNCPALSLRIFRSRRASPKEHPRTSSQDLMVWPFVSPFVERGGILGGSQVHKHYKYNPHPIRQGA